MSIKRTPSGSPIARSARLLAAAVGLATATALALPTAAAASPPDYSTGQLSEVGDAVRRSGGSTPRHPAHLEGKD